VVMPQWLTILLATNNLLDVQFHPELIDPEAFIAPGSVVCGQVILGSLASIWFGAVVRGDTATIRIGDSSNIQDLCVVHADPGFPCTIGCRVTLGHGAIVHGATIEDDVLIGIRAVVLNGAIIGKGSIVAAGAIVTEGTVIAPGQLVMGTPARVVRACTLKDEERIAHAAEHYVDAANAYRQKRSDC
jgi:carbonic anhydrase/acetyltransferase-like protein (isoleucine patch superfamily)